MAEQQQEQLNQLMLQAHRMRNNWAMNEIRVVRTTRPHEIAACLGWLGFPSSVA
jgi:hypothetical protein